MDQRELMHQWVRTWREAGVALEVIRRRDLQQTDTLKALAVLESAFNQALHSLPPRTTSGMIEMQMWFKKLRA